MSISARHAGTGIATPIRVLAGASAAAVIGTAVTIAGTATAHADAIETYTNEATGLRMDGSDGGVRTAPVSGTSSQRWSVHKWRDGTVQFRNMRTDQCLSHMGDLTYATSYPCFAGSDSRSVQQSWYIKHWNDGTIRFQNQNSQQCLDGSTAGRIFMRPCNSSEAQSWY
ncbi:RICIN domain-containing protein [Microlunatus soli]|uniref:Cytolethal distending toxin A/C domain-containing protein n=1 Tax=Microlunatus soli TaxID=630515 RepID=A0A1H1VKP0_9ACTN|nr:RICIN domain-containing protein [Microlunatus soli]SDS85372.1 Cytolethal distending toxin A/C domain-containing protein [Microlunatus soli]